MSEPANHSNQSSPKHIAPSRFEPVVITPTAFAPSDGIQRRRRLKIKPLKILLASLLGLGVLVMWFLFSTKAVVINTSPEHSTFSIESPLVFELKGHFLMLRGQYRVHAEAPGYLPLTTEITIDKQQNQQLTLALTKRPGSLTVTTNDGVIGEVFLDGEKIGQSGAKLDDISAGDHQLKLVAERYFPYTQMITIEGMEQHQHIKLALKPAWANVNITTEPSGASLISNSVIIGNTPYDGTLLEGKHELSLSLEGYKPWSESIQVSAGVAVKLPRIYLEKADGILNLTSTPSLVSVMLDGKYQGLTPIQLALSPNKRHNLAFFKDGYQQTQQQVTLASDQQETLAIKLEAKLGQVSVHADQEDALLYIDDILMGRANQTVTLTVKQHKVMVEKEGYVTYNTTVLPRADLQQIVDVRLKTLEQARWESYPLQWMTSQGSELKLFKPSDLFTMGASRREQGRRANEVSRRVSLKRPFYLATKEITNAQFRQFSRQHSSGHVKGNSLNNNDHPVVNVSWKEAALFCNWLSEKDKLPLFYQVKDDEIVGINLDATGYRLPTEAEWAWSTRLQDGQMLKYPWGSKLPPTPNSGNFADRSGAAILGFIQATYDDKYPVTSPVGSYPPNEKGLYDLSGNAAEWMHDFYEVKTGLSSKVEHDPLGADKGDYHVIRGSSWAHGTMTELRLSFRDYGIEPRNDVGFRLARFVDIAEVLSE